MNDVENWYETEGTMSSQGLPGFSQKDQTPLRKIGGVLRSIGIGSYKIYKGPTASMGKILRIEDAARFIVAMRRRLKTRKACRDMIFAEKYFRQKRHSLHRTVIRARKILEGKAC